MDSTKRYASFLLFSVLVISTCGLIYELIAGAMASYLLGDSIRQFSFIIGIYLFAMGIGSYLSKFITEHLLEKFITIEQIIGVLGGLSSIILFLLFHYDYYFSFILYSLVLLIGICVGIEIPLLMNILKDKFEFKDLVANIFTFDYIGALFASIAFPVVLIPNLGIVKTSLIFGGINLLISIIFIYQFRHEIRNHTRLMLSGGFFSLVLLVLYIFSDEILKYSEERLLGEKVIFYKQTPYQRIVLTRGHKDVKLFLNNNLQFSKQDEYRYHEALVHPAMSMSKCIENVLVMGGGDGMAIREILKYKDVKKITLVELDSEMSSLFKNNSRLRTLNNHALNHEKVKIINQDAFMWVKKCQEKFDVIIIDFPDPSNYSVGKLYTNYFYSFVRKLCTNNTRIVVQSTSPFFAPKSFWIIKSTLHSIFPNVMPYHTYLPSFGEWGFVLCSPESLVHINDSLYHKVDSLRFYDYRLDKLANFAYDMRSSDTVVNSIYNQNLVRVFDQEWESMQ